MYETTTDVGKDGTMRAAILGVCVLLGAIPMSFGNTNEVERWGMFEVSLTGPESGNPFLDVELSAMFTQGDRAVEPRGFYDGEGVYRIRFMPDAVGEWRYVTQSNRKELDGETGTFVCVEPSPDNHGPVLVHKTYYLAYADGTPYHQFGTTCYAWTHQGDEMEEQTLKTLAGAPFNKLRMCVFPKHYSYNKNDPPEYAFERDSNEKQDFTRFNPRFFQRFERRVLDVQKLGIEADVIVFHPYDRWGYQDMDAETDDRYLRYLIARLAAYRNVWWSLANEYDFMEHKEESDWDRFFQIIRDNDPYGRLRGIHNGRRWYDHNKPWVTHASLQTSHFAGGIGYREKYQKPVIYDECRYEGNIPQGWGNLTPVEMMRSFWLGTLSGCYVGHGETYKHPQDLLWWAKGGVLRGESPPRIAFLKEFMKNAPPFEELNPISGDDAYILAKPGEYYLAYFASPQTIALDLAGDRPYRIDGIDPWEMKEVSIGTATPGDYTFSSPRADYVYRFTPYAPGERIRPVAKATASATHGSAPLDVRFSAEGTQKHHWDFGDGTSSIKPEPAHTFEKPGRYVVTLTVTDAEGASSTTALSIGVLPSAPKDLGQYKNWPGTYTGLVYLWDNAKQSNAVLDDEGETIRACGVEAKGEAKIGPRGDMQILGGSFAAKDVDDELLNACKTSNQLTVEAIVTADNLEAAGPARIITFSKDTASRDFTLGQERDSLVLRLRTPRTGNNGLSPQVTLCKIEAHKPMHVVVSYFPGNTLCYVNGEVVYTSSDIQGSFGNWEPCHLLFGDEYSGGRSWSGNLEGIAIYSRFVGPEEARHKFMLCRDRI